MPEAKPKFPPPLQRTPTLIPPHYDIDALLDTDYRSSPKAAYDAIDKIYMAIEKRPPGGALWFRPDSALLEPEVCVRDLWNFVNTMNSGFYSSLGYGGGFTCFFRAVRALRIVRHKKTLALAEQVKDAMVAHGISEPGKFADDNQEGADIDWDSELDASPDFWDQIEKVIRPLDDQWWNHGKYINAQIDPADPPLYYGICLYLEAHRPLLRCRKIPA